MQHFIIIILSGDQAMWPVTLPSYSFTKMPEHLPFLDLIAIICCSALFSHSFVCI